MFGQLIGLCIVAYLVALGTAFMFKGRRGAQWVNRRARRVVALPVEIMGHLCLTMARAIRG